MSFLSFDTRGGKMPIRNHRRSPYTQVALARCKQPPNQGVGGLCPYPDILP